MDDDGDHAAGTSDGQGVRASARGDFCQAGSGFAPYSADAPNKTINSGRIVDSFVEWHLVVIAQPLAIRMNEGVCLAVEVDPHHIERRLETGYCDEMASTLDEALAQVREACNTGQPLSIGLIGNAAEVYPELVRRGILPDMVTDQTSAHDALNGYIPAGLSLQEADELRKRDPQGYIARSLESMVTHVRAMLEMQKMGAIVFDYGNNLRGQALAAGETHALDFPGFVPAYIRPLFCRGKGPFRWVALSGDPEDIYRTDEAILELFPEDTALKRWITLARQKIHFQGLPARICWLGYGERDKAGLAFNELVRKGVVKAPIVIGRDHLDSGSVASPYRETEAMRRQRRHRRLAPAQCPVEYGIGRDVGLHPSRWWRRHRLLHPCRAGDRGRWHTGGSAAAGASADQRSRHRRDASRRCRV